MPLPARPTFTAFTLWALAAVLPVLLTWAASVRWQINTSIRDFTHQLPLLREGRLPEAGLFPRDPADIATFRRLIADYDPANTPITFIDESFALIDVEVRTPARPYRVTIARDQTTGHIQALSVRAERP